MQLPFSSAVPCICRLDPRPKPPPDEAPSPEANEPPPPKPKERKEKKESSSRSGGSKEKSGGGQDKEMMDFRHLMVKGLELKKTVKGSSEKCVIYMDVTCRTFFCAKLKNAANAKAYRIEEISEAHASGDNEKIISIAHKDGSLDLEVSSPKVSRCMYLDTNV